MVNMVVMESGQVHDVDTQSEDVRTKQMIADFKSIIISRSRDGATVDEIIDDFKEHNGENLLSVFRNRDLIADYLRHIEGVWSTYNAPNGPYLWYCTTQKTQHLVDMIKKQKSPRMNSRRYQVPRYQPPRTHFTTGMTVSGSGTTNSGSGTTASASGPRDKFFEDNINFIPKRNAWNRSQHRSALSHPYLPPQRRQMQQAKPMMQRRYHSNVPNMGPNFCGYQMIGDDFFLSLARWELGYTFDPGHTIQQSGLCISGLTIAEAADRVMKASYINDRVIVNIGVVDLLHGHDFIDMQQDLLQLMQNLESRGASVILTTLSPLANSFHIPGVTDRLQKFNSLIRKHQWQYIDLWRCFVNEKDNTLYECFQPGPRHVSGSNQPHVLWNKLGRQRIIKFLKTHLAAFI